MLTAILAKILTSGPLLLLTLITEDECILILSSKTICRKKCSSQQDALHFTKAIKKFDIAIQTSHGVPLFAQDEYKYWNLTLFQLLQDSNPIIKRKMYRKL